MLLVFLLNPYASVLHNEYYLLLDRVIIDVYENGAFFCVLNCILYYIQGHLKQPLFVPYHLLRQYLVSVHFGHIFQYGSVFNLLVKIIKQFLYLLYFDQLDKHLVLVWHLREVGVKQQLELLFLAAKLKVYHAL